MKSKIAVFVLAFVFGLPAYGQVQIGAATESASPRLQKLGVDPVSGTLGSYPLCGSIFLHDKEQSLLQYLAQHPEAAQPPLRKTGSWGFSVNSTHSWYAYDYTTTNQYLTPSTCRAVGVHCYIFVEDSMWSSGRVDQGVVDSVMNVFDNTVPANPNKGVYQMDVDAFGNPPDVDSDPRIVILLLNIRDGWNGTGGYIEGYFYGLNELNVAGSNNAEIYFLDSYPSNLKSSAGLESGMSVTAHEFQHMIHWNYNKSQITFINEGCSLTAEVNCGYPIYTQYLFASETNHYLLDWRKNDINLALYDYSRAARYFDYLREQFGMQIFAPIVQNGTISGIPSIAYGLSQVGSARNFNQVFLDWEIANTLDDRSVDPAFGYTYPGLDKAVAEVHANPNIPATTEWIQPLAAKYISFTAGSNLSITSTTSSSTITAKVVEVGSPSVVNQLTSGVQFTEPGFGSTYSKVTLALMNTSPYDSQQVTVQAAGTAPGGLVLEYEHQEPTGYLALRRGDTAAVHFDGVAGARLDSIRVALRRANSITGGVWSFGAVGHVLGTPLCPAFEAVGTLNPSFPYPVPWPNWVTVDLRSYNIDATNQFAVGFAYQGDSTVQQRLMVSPQPTSAGIHSFTLYNEVSPPSWYYLTSNSAGDSVWAFLIKAYVSFPAAAVEPSQQLLPTADRLDQNYPNPFNPTTTIQYTVGGIRGQGSGASEVRIVICDVLGREVATLVNTRQAPGTYKVQFDASRFSSGVYFYRLTAGKSTVTKAMVVEK